MPGTRCGDTPISANGLTGTPSHWRFWTVWSRATATRTCCAIAASSSWSFGGRIDEVASEYEACLARLPGYGSAAYQLARLHRHEHSARYLEQIETGLRQVGPGSRARADLEFARYHLLEGLGRTGAAWQALASANGIMHS